MPRPRLPASHLLLSFAAVFACLLLTLSDPLPVRELRNALFDQFQRWQPRVYTDVPVRIVDIDEASLARLGQWPWPRNRVAELVDRLREAGAGAIAFDVLFAEPDRTSPQSLLASGSLPPQLARQVQDLPDHDRELAQSLAAAPTVLGFAATAGDTGAGLPMSRYGLAVAGEPPLAHIATFPGAVRALPVLETAAHGNGALTFQPDTDGVVRRVPMFIGLGGDLRPSLVAEALRVQQRAGAYRITADSAGISRIDVGRLHIPTTSAGELWVYYTRNQPSRSIPAWQVLQGQALDGVNGSIVLVGTSAQGLQDLRFSPLGGIVPGVQVHAQALEQIVSGEYLLRPGWARVVEALALLAGGLALCSAVLRFGALTSALITGLALLLFNGIGWYAFSVHRLLLDLFTPSLALALIFAVASIARHRATEREQRWVREAFSRYVSPNLVNHLVAHPEALALGGHRQPCSFVFTDLAGFTEMLERQAPEAVVSLLNVYLERVIRIAFGHDGTLDRIVGDAVAIMFSAPLPQADHQARALACALDIQRFAQGYVAELAARGVEFGHTRIGVHAGDVVVGNFGGSTIFDYRALGDPVNTAARLESLNQHLGTTLCVSEAIQQHCPEVPMRAIGRVQLKGKAQAVRVFEPVAVEDAAYAEAFELLAEQSAGALAAFQRLHAERPADGLVAFHLQRLLAGEVSELFVMTRK